MFAVSIKLVCITYQGLRTKDKRPKTKNAVPSNRQVQFLQVHDQSILSNGFRRLEQDQQRYVLIQHLAIYHVGQKQVTTTA